MSEIIQLGAGAVIQAGPGDVVDQGTFPSDVASIPLSLVGAIKPYIVSTGVQLYNWNTTLFTALPGVGSAGPVTQAHTLYMRTVVYMKVRLTYQNDASPHITYVLGMLLLEFDPGNNPVVLVEAIGAGQLQMLAVGNQ